MIIYELQEEKLILGDINIFGFWGILRDTSKSERLKLECYFELMQKYNYPIDRIEFDLNDILIYKDFDKTELYIIIGFNKSKKQILERAQKLSAHFAVCASKKSREVINLKENCRCETDIPNYYQTY